MAPLLRRRQKGSLMILHTKSRMTPQCPVWSKADICAATSHVRFTPKATLIASFDMSAKGQRRTWRAAASYLPASKRLIPAPVRARALTPPKFGTSSRMYPAAIRRSLCSSGMVRRIGLMRTSFKDSNSSLVSGTNGRFDILGNLDRTRAMPSMLL